MTYQETLFMLLRKKQSKEKELKNRLTGKTRLRLSKCQHFGGGGFREFHFELKFNIYMCEGYLMKTELRSFWSELF